MIVENSETIDPQILENKKTIYIQHYIYSHLCGVTTLESIPSFDQIQELRKVLRDISIAHWYGDDLFSWQWWLLFAASILPWVFWYKYFLPRKEPSLVYTYGLILGVMATFWDVIGVDLLLWAYPTKLVPMVPPLFPADLSVIPVSFMLIYSAFRDWKRYALATLLCSAFFAYIVEPLFISSDMFVINKPWTHSYSFVGLFLLTLFCKWFTQKIYAKFISNLGSA